MTYEEMATMTRLHIDDVHKTRFDDPQLLLFLNAALRKVWNELLGAGEQPVVSQATVTMDAQVTDLAFTFHKLLSVQDVYKEPIPIVSEEKARRSVRRCCFIRKGTGTYDNLGWYVDVTGSFDLTVQYIPNIPILTSAWTDTDNKTTCLSIDEQYHDIVTIYAAILALGPYGVNVQTYQGLYADFKETLIASVNPNNQHNRMVVDADDWYE